MLVSTPSGQAVNVQRRWLPWRLRKRDFGTGGGLDSFDLPGFDDLAGFAVGLVMTIVWLLIGGLIISIAFLFGEALLLLLLVLPLLAVARMFWVLPWIVEATNGDAVLGVAKVRGWRDSEARIREIAAAYQRGQDPFVSQP